VATIRSGKITLEGAYPDEKAHAEILSAADGADDRMRIASGAPLAYAAGASFGMAALADLDDGEVTLTDTSLTVAGRAKSSEAFDALQRLPQSVPAGIKLAALKVTPPLASPYVWLARFDGTSVTISGNAPDASLAEALRAAAPANVPVSGSLVLASGEPAGFADNAVTLLKSLLKLEQGEASISDSEITLRGAPGSSATADEVRTAVAALGGKADLEPPRIAEFAFSIDKSAEGLAISGFVPDAATRDRLASLPGADVSKLALARGAPGQFTSAVDFGLQVLAHLESGQFGLKGNRLSLGGRSASVTEFDAASALVGQGAPPGFALAAAELHPPVAAPFTWSAAKDEAGAVTLSGDVPNDMVRMALLSKAGASPSDKMVPADGAPDSFAVSAGKGLDILALLDTGTVTFDGTNWAIEGNVDTPQKGFAADAAYSVAGLRTAGWSYAVHTPTPALPIIAPYVWRAQKASDGAISFAGYAPSDDVRTALKSLAPAATDGTALGAGAPDDFEASAKAGLAALVAMDEGTLGLAGDRWTLTGTTGSTATRTSIQSALADKVDTAAWQIAIQAKDAAQVVSPYVWSASRNEDGSIELSGYVPSDELRVAAAAHAGTVARDTTTIASGDPPGFADDLLAGLDALARLRSGRAAYDGSKWHLTGSAASPAEAEAAVATLGRGSRGGALWDHQIDGLADTDSSASVASAEQAPGPASAVAAPDITSVEPPATPSASAGSPSGPSSLAASEDASSAASAQGESSVPERPSSSLEPLSPPSSASSAEPSSPDSAAASSSASGGASPQPPSSSPAVSAEATNEVAPTSLHPVPPMPDRLVFEADRSAGGSIRLEGAVPDASTAGLYGMLAGGADTANLKPQDGLPADFAPSGASGVAALAELDEGRLGFDGSRWWLRGKAQQPSVLDDVKTRVAALPNGAEWSVGVEQMSALDVCRMRVGRLSTRNAIVFQSGKAVLVDSSMPVLDEVADDLKACPKADVHVQGHTDSDGDADSNLALSVARAEAVAAELVKRGVSESRVYAEGYGETDPVVPNDSRDNKARNRRIEFELTEE
jgi:outer membrane protein OmpA-like peptidoglycan-associated protein